MDVHVLRARLAAIGQDHVLRFYDRLKPESRQRIISQLTSLDLESLPGLIETYVKNKPPVAIPSKIEPVSALPQKADAPRVAYYQQARAKGNELLEQGKVAAFLVAGGQGTRLGYEGPKGEFLVTPVKNKPLFQVFAEQLLAHGRDAGKPIPWYIMTSDVNDSATRAFFQRHNHFGFNPDMIRFFQQGMMPAFSMDGKLLMSDIDSLALSPDGHGGSLRALARSGALADMRARGIEHLSYFQVDNPLVHCIDPLFLGLHALSGSGMSSKTVTKAGPTEKVGNFVIGDGVVQVIEYSDLPEAMARQTNPDGSLRFNFGSIAIHALTVAFIETLNSGGPLRMPWHRAEKKVPAIDDRGILVKPDKPNAVKLEQFVFDAIPLAANPLVFITDRAEEFSPVKNAEGADSPTTCRRDQIRRAAKWLTACGIEIPRDGTEADATLEISPLFAVTIEQLVAKGKTLPRQIKPGAHTYFGD
jgi:UDP-N-acetylglucosamine/UDP-N-acetylgalactosamine diphosphorylase